VKERMVEVLESWEAFVEHVKYCRWVLFKTEEQPGEAVRLRVRAGSFGFDRVLSRKEAEERLSWLRTIGAIKVLASVPDAVFFS